MLQLGPQRRLLRQALENADVSKIQVDGFNTGRPQGFQHQVNDFLVRATASAPEQLTADLQRCAAGQHAAGAGVQHMPGVAQAGYARAAQAVGIHPRRLGRHVGAYAHQSPCKLIGQLEGLQIQIIPRSRQQRLEVLDHRRDNELVAPAPVGIHQPPTQRLDLLGTRRQDIGHPVGQQPSIGRTHWDRIRDC